MKTVLNIIIALVIAVVLWNIIVQTAFTIVHLLVSIAIIAAFLWVLSAVYRAITKEKIL